MDQPDINDLLRRFKASIVGELHTMMPGKILRYHPLDQTADVQPMVKRVVYDPETLAKTYESYPAIPRVPVNFPGGSGLSITWPLDAGDTVDLIFCESSLADYLQTGQESAQQDVRRHSLAYPICYPTRHPAPSPSTDPTTQNNDSMMLGQENGLKIVIDPTNGRVVIGTSSGDFDLSSLTTDFVALSKKVDDALENIRNVVNQHQHLSAAPGSSTTPVPAGPTAQAINAQPSTAAAVLRAK